MLATPYVHLDDLLMLGLAAWLILRAKTPAWTWIYVLTGIVAVEGEPFWGPAPALAVEVGALVLLSVAALQGAAVSVRDDLPLPQTDARLPALRPKQ